MFFIADNQTMPIQYTNNQAVPITRRCQSNIFALIKPQLKDIAVHFFPQYVGQVNKWNNYTGFK